jgi:hypothetical protein
METKQMHRRDTFSLMKAVRNCSEDLFWEQDVDFVGCFTPAVCGAQEQ